MFSVGYLRGRLSGRKQAIIGYYQGLSSDERERRIDAHAQGLAGARLAGYQHGAREIDPAKLSYTIKEQALAPSSAGDSRWVNMQRTNSALVRTNMRLQCYLCGFLAVLICLALVAVAAATHEFRVRAVLFYLLAAGFLYLNVWWLPRRALHADLAYAAMTTAPRPTPHDRTRVALARAKWTLGQLVGLLGGVALLAVLLTPLTGPAT